MGVLKFHAGHRSGRSSVRGTPVSRSMADTNSAGTPFLERVSQYQTCDCVVPIRSASGFWPPATSHARRSASEDMFPKYGILSKCQPKSMSGLAHQHLDNLDGMKAGLPSWDFGQRVKQLRLAHHWTTAQLSSRVRVSQQQISYYESGKVKNPNKIAHLLAEALGSTPDFLLRGTGAQGGPPPVLSAGEVVDYYQSMSEDEQRRLSEFIRSIQGDKRYSR